MPCLWYTSSWSADMMWALTVGRPKGLEEEGAFLPGSAVLCLSLQVWGTRQCQSVSEAPSPRVAFQQVLSRHLPRGAPGTPEGGFSVNAAHQHTHSSPHPWMASLHTPKSSFPARVPASTSVNISIQHALSNKIWISALTGRGGQTRHLLADLFLSWALCLNLRDSLYVLLMCTLWVLLIKS